MRRKLLALATLALAGTLLFSSAAAPGGDRIHEDIVLSPSEEPNGAYAVMEDGELALRFDASNPDVDGEGVNPGTVTPFDTVFTVTYTGEQRARIWLTTDVDDVQFYRGYDPEDGLDSRETAVVLGPDQTVSVGVLIDATDGSVAADADQFTVHAEVDDGAATPTDGGENTGGSDGGGGGTGGSDGDGSGTSGGGGGDGGPDTETPRPTATPDGTVETHTPDTGTVEGGAGGPGTGGSTPTPTSTQTVTVEDDGGAADDPGDADDPGSTPTDQGTSVPWWLVPVILGVLVGIALVARWLDTEE